MELDAAATLAIDTAGVGRAVVKNLAVVSKSPPTTPNSGKQSVRALHYYPVCVWIADVMHPQLVFRWSCMLRCLMYNAASWTVCLQAVTEHILHDVMHLALLLALHRYHIDEVIRMLDSRSIKLANTQLLLPAVLVADFCTVAH